MDMKELRQLYPSANHRQLRAMQIVPWSWRVTLTSSLGSLGLMLAGAAIGSPAIWHVAIILAVVWIGAGVVTFPVALAAYRVTPHAAPTARSRRGGHSHPETWTDLAGDTLEEFMDFLTQRRCSEKA